MEHFLRGKRGGMIILEAGRTWKVTEPTAGSKMTETASILSGWLEGNYLRGQSDLTSGRMVLKVACPGPCQESCLPQLTWCLCQGTLSICVMPYMFSFPLVLLTGQQRSGVEIQEKYEFETFFFSDIFLCLSLPNPLFVLHDLSVNVWALSPF